MERIRDFHDYALYKFTFTFTLHLVSTAIPQATYSNKNENIGLGLRCPLTLRSTHWVTLYFA